MFIHTYYARTRVRTYALSLTTDIDQYYERSRYYGHVRAHRQAAPARGRPPPACGGVQTGRLIRDVRGGAGRLIGEGRWRSAHARIKGLPAAARPMRLVDSPALDIGIPPYWLLTLVYVFPP